MTTGNNNPQSGKDDSKRALKLNVGCGNKKIHGFVNLDGRAECNPDAVCDILELPQYFPKDSIDLIYACHVIEHIPKDKLVSTLESWSDLLKFDGKLRLSVPNFDMIVHYYRMTGDLKSLQSYIHGGQKYPYDHHYTTFNRESLEELLKYVGFREITEWDWRHTEHTYVDDYSQAFLPHMDKLTGFQMSLNLEAKN